MSLVLIVDDDEIQRAIAAAVLRTSGHEIMEATDGASALQITWAHHPELIICDVLMPGMSGYEFVAELRLQDSAIADTPVILLTALSERADMRAGMNSGADDYLPKPFDPIELQEAARALIAKRQVQREAVLTLVRSELEAALVQQKQELAREYERRFVAELNSRWERQESANSELNYDDATVLMVDVFGALLKHASSAPDYVECVRAAYQTARDSLLLFGATQLLPRGDNLLAIFSDEAGEGSPSAQQRALRAATGLQQSLPALVKRCHDDCREAVSFVAALHTGPVALLQLSDPLHGEDETRVAAGPTLETLDAMHQAARESGWRIAASPNVLSRAGFPVKAGASLAVGAVQAIEFISLA